MRSKLIYLIFLFAATLSSSITSADKPNKKNTPTKLIPIVAEPALQELLTHAVQSWQVGNASAAYATLDSIHFQELNESNASTKTKAAIWTATYLQAQHKFRQAAIFLDSALRYATSYAKAEELKRTHEAYSEYYLAIGNSKGAIASLKAATKIKDSLSQSASNQAVDSLQKEIAKYKQQSEITYKNELDAANNNANTIGTASIIMGVIIGLLLIVLLLLYGKLQRLKSLPPAPITRKIEKPANNPVAEQNKDTLIAEESKVSKAETGFPKLEQVPTSNSSKSLTARLSEVELVLIRADVLCNYGDQKSIKKLLTEYNTQLPLIMKSLDDAITLNENESFS